MASILKNKYFSEPKEFRDPVHGDIRLYKYELDIINTRAFQRLRGIRQLAACEIVWFGATHTRFQHSLGTLAMVEKICESISKREYEIPIAKHIIIRLFALLHDVGHVPFGHTLEDERPVISEKHDDETRVRRIIQGEIEAVLNEIDGLFSQKEKEDAGIYTEQKKSKGVTGSMNLTELLVFLITSGKGETIEEDQEVEVSAKYRLYLDLVSNTVCADLFDYLSRDTYFTGLRRAYDEKILSHLVIWRDRLAVDLGQPRCASEVTEAAVRTRGGIVTEISNLLRVRYTLAERVYFNDTKSCASAMISQAVQSARVSVKTLSTMRDDELLCYLENVELCSLSQADYAQAAKCTLPSSEDMGAFSDLFGQNTLDLWNHISSRWTPTIGETQAAAQQIVAAYKRRNIFRPVYRLRTEDIKVQRRTLLCRYIHNIEHAWFRRKLENWLAEMCGLRTWQVIIYCPAPQMNVKVAKTHVGPLPGGAYKEMDKLTPEDVNGNDALKVLKEESLEIQKMHSVLWSMEVLVDDEAPDEGLRYASVCSQALFNHRNALVPDLGSGNTIEDVRRSNLRTAFVEAEMIFDVNTEEGLLKSRFRDSSLYTNMEFLRELKALKKDKNLFEE